MQPSFSDKKKLYPNELFTQKKLLKISIYPKKKCSISENEVKFTFFSPVLRRWYFLGGV